ncbi:Coiled-coil domain-containing protein 40 [Fasciola hepatica]|uniref:Coiled-coil domain-containing protein 40 n=1 Tax=Fasciola hepatica TaxID=6192 RepID=A0A4E0R9K7_FASHE|nr:Coiled-coil domain-containing protein 40 [Fasciola hepatica]
MEIEEQPVEHHSDFPQNEPEDTDAHDMNPQNPLGTEGGIEEQDMSELVVLDPEHPLMKRFQDALRNMITKHISSSEVTMRERDEEIKREKATHVELGCELYNFQQELAKFQGQLEKKHSKYNELMEKVTQSQKDLKNLREHYTEVLNRFSEETKRMHAMRDEVDALCLRLFYLNTAKEEIMSDIMVMQRAAEKATIDLSKHEDEKQQQDILVDRLQNKVDQLKEDIALYEAQIIAQEAEMVTSQNLLNEAEAQIVSISVDRKHLMSQWNVSLLGLQRRNEVYNALNKAYNDLREQLLILENEQLAHRRSIIKEQEKHEKLTALVNKNEADLNTIKKQTIQVTTRYETDKQSYSTYSRMLQETERNLARAQNEMNNCQSEVETLRRGIEQESTKKVELDAKISAELRDRLAAKKSMEYVKKLNTNIKDQSRELLSQIAQLENQIARDELTTATKQAENQRLREQLRDLDAEIEERNTLVSKLEAEIHHATIQVERKQSSLDLLNRKLERLLHDAGGQEVGPLEATINNLNKALSAKQEEIGELEQQWLKEQNELVLHVNERDELANSVTRLQKQLSILAQKRLRVDNEIAIQERDKAELERELKHLRNNTTRLNALIAKERTAGEHLVNENKLAETDFVRALREKEAEAVEMQSKLDSIKKEREEMLNELVEVERTIMLWEKKVQLCDETRRAVDCDLGQGELSVMKHEIHRMEVRKNSLLQQQEKLLQALERSVSRRDLIILQSNTKQSKQQKAQLRINAQRQLDELRKKLKATKKIAKSSTTELQELTDQVQSLEQELATKKTELEEQQKSVDEMTAKLQVLSDEKQINLFRIQMKQHETTYWDLVREGRYRRLCATATSSEAEYNRQMTRVQTLFSIIEKLEVDFPQIRRDLFPVRHILESRLHPEEQLSPTEESATSVPQDPVEQEQTTRRSDQIATSEGEK